MAVAIMISIFASFLWGITNHIDKFMINGVDEAGSSIKTLIVFSTLITGIVFSPIWLIVNKFSVNIGTISLISVFASTVVYVLATFFYFKALNKNDASIVVTMFHLIPVFSYFLALIFFKENLAARQIVGSIIIIISSIIISLDIEKKGKKDRFKALVLMTLSALFYAVYFILFDNAIRNSSFNSCAFWFQIGFLIIGIILMCVKSYRNTFVSAIKNNGKLYLSLNITNEVLNLIANLLVNFANLTLPIAIANVCDGFQGAFVFILGILGMKFLPKYFKENLNKKVVIQKITCITLGIIGLTVMFLK